MNPEQLAASLSLSQLNGLMKILSRNISPDDLYDVCEAERSKREALAAFERTKANYSGAFAALADRKGDDEWESYGVEQ